VVLKFGIIQFYQDYVISKKSDLQLDLTVAGRNSKLQTCNLITVTNGLLNSDFVFFYSKTQIRIYMILLIKFYYGSSLIP
jgi:hypothetical protein